MYPRLKQYTPESKPKIFVAGHGGMVGSAIMRRLEHLGHSNIITASKSYLNLTKQSELDKYMWHHRPDAVIDCAAKVGGIHANNKYRADFIYDNLQIQNNLIKSSQNHNVKKLIFLGSSCIYPKFCDQPIKEEYLLASPLEYTNEPYAVAKIAGIKMCESFHKQYGCNFLAIMPTNQYGPNDNYHNLNAHVLPALLRRFHEAKVNDSPSVDVWGTGKARREFMYVDDLADACVFILENVEAEDVYSLGISHLNIGTGKDVSIEELSRELKETVGYSGKVNFLLDKPDGTMKKLLNVSRMRDFGWNYKTDLKDGLAITYENFKESVDKLVER